MARDIAQAKAAGHLKQHQASGKALIARACNALQGGLPKHSHRKYQESQQLSPLDPYEFFGKQAIRQVISANTFLWRGAIAVHMHSPSGFLISIETAASTKIHWKRPAGLYPCRELFVCSPCWDAGLLMFEGQLGLRQRFPCIMASSIV